MTRKRKAEPMQHSRVVDHIKLCIEQVMKNDGGEAADAIHQALHEAQQVVDLVLDKGTDDVDAYSLDVLQSAFGPQDQFQNVMDTMGDLLVACVGKEVMAMTLHDLAVLP